jgi:tight adherence protein C
LSQLEDIMSTDIALPLAAVFISVALAVGSLASMALARTSPARRRLQPMVGAGSAPPKAGLFDQLFGFVRPARNKARQLSKMPEGASTKVSRLQRRMELAGWTDAEAAGYYALAEMVVPIIFGLLPLAVLGTEGWLLAIIAAVLGYLAPDVVLTRATRRHQKAIQNGLPDAIDLIVVCVEAGSSLDQAIMRAAEELELALPALARELRTVTNEIRAGKPRLEAFQGLAKRTQVEDVRALVSMLTQTDRFGTSIAQALRTHASTSRTKRRQRAEERAAKVGVKLVFPLALCLVPALYVVCLGPVVIRILRALM